MSNGTGNGITPNAKRLLYGGFAAILAAGVGAAIRGGILANWGAEFGFTGQQLGDINGAGFTGFCFGIVIGGVVADKIGYGKLVIAAFLFHMLSAFVTFGATTGMSTDAAYSLLYWGTFIFAVANGTLEAVANPLVATLFPHNRTHYLNILHASWPAGLALGSAAGWLLGEQIHWGWKAQLALFLVPTAAYGLIFLGQHFPKSEASAKGLSLGEMFKDVGILGALVVCFLLAMFFGGVLTPFFKDSPDTAKNIGYAIGGVLVVAVGVITRFSFGSLLLFVLFITHALIGAVELGTDGWIQNITGNILTTGQGKILFFYTSILMFSLRFCADFIEKNLKISPVGLLLICASLACIGLNLVSGITTFVAALLALTVYALGKTFFWPTMLAVASDRFPRTGAIAISIMGGIGMMSAGLIGSAGRWFAQTRFCREALGQANAAVYAQYKVEKPKAWLFLREVNAIDGKKLGEVQGKLSQVREDLAKSGNKDPQAALTKLSPEEKTVYESSITGDRKTLKADSFIPATMACIYLLLLLYFQAIGGYKVGHIAATVQEAKPAS